MKGKILRRALVTAACLSFAMDGHALDCEKSTPELVAAAKQKVALLDRLLHGSEPARRVDEGDNAESQATLDAARRSLTDAQSALGQGCGATASALSADGLRLAAQAFRAAPPVSGLRDKQLFEQALQQSTSFLLALEAQPAELQGLDAGDLVGIERQIERAETLAATGSFGEAIKLLRPITDRLQRRLFEILDQKTLYYEIHFATPRDEYLYFVEQYDGYQILLRSDQVKASYSARRRISEFLATAAARREQAAAMATAGEWPGAIAAMQEAVDHSEKAVRATGYAY
jgi:hypothetical protein